MLDQVREEAQVDAVLHDPVQYKSMQTTDKSQFQDRECYEVKLTKPDGKQTTEFYDIETGMLIGSTEVQETPLGAVPVTAVLGEYKKFGGFMFATKLAQKMGPLTQVMTITNMDFEPIDDVVFTVPESIRALMKKK